MADDPCATAASIPYEGTDCTPEEAVEAVKAVRTTAAGHVSIYAIVWLMGLGAFIIGCFAALATWSVRPLAVAGVGLFFVFVAVGAAQDACDRGDQP